MLTGPMEYSVQLTDDREHPCLLGTWDSFPFVIEIPEGHEGWLLVSGDWEEAAPASPEGRDCRQRQRLEPGQVLPHRRRRRHPHRSAGTRHLPHRPVRRGHRRQLRLHLDTALSACTQALSLVGPLLPEI